MDASPQQGDAPQPSEDIPDTHRPPESLAVQSAEPPAVQSAESPAVPSAQANLFLTPGTPWETPLPSHVFSRSAEAQVRDVLKHSL